MIFLPAEAFRRGFYVIFVAEKFFRKKGNLGLTFSTPLVIIIKQSFPGSKSAAVLELVDRPA